MGQFKYIPPDEVAARHRAPPRQSVNTRTIERQPAQRNVEQVLSLGSDRYVTYRNRTYRIPPVPYKLGQAVLNQHIAVLAAARQTVKTGKKEPAEQFYRELDKVAVMMWQHIRPLGKFKRLLWRTGLMKNPLREGSEAEIKAITDFFLQCRMTSSVRSMPEKEATS